MIDEFNEHHQDYVQPEPVETPKPLKRLDLNGDYYCKAMEDFNRYREVVEKHGLAKPHVLTAERVMIEMNALTNGDTVLSNFCASHVLEWYKDKNPHHLDMVYSACIQGGFEPPPTVVSVMGKVTAARINGDPSGSPDKIIRNNFKGQALIVMLNLIYAGADLKEAASKAAHWHNTTFTDIAKRKASSLDKDYSKIYRQCGINGQTLEQEYFNNWDKNKTKEANAYWEKARATMPEADEETKGVRHR